MVEPITKVINGAQIYQSRILVPLAVLLRPPFNIPDNVRNGRCGLRHRRLLTRFEAAYDTVSRRLTRRIEGEALTIATEILQKCPCVDERRFGLRLKFIEILAMDF